MPINHLDCASKIVAEVAGLCAASTVPAVTINQISGKFRLIDQKYELCIVGYAIRNPEILLKIV